MLSFTLNGTFLIVMGAVWTEVRLSPPVKTAAFWIALYRTYAKWFFATLGATLGTAVANPISAAGHHGQPWQESLGGAGFLSVSIAMIVCPDCNTSRIRIGSAKDRPISCFGWVSSTRELVRLIRTTAGCRRSCAGGQTARRA